MNPAVFVNEPCILAYMPFLRNALGVTLIHHQGIISPLRRDFASSSGVAFDRSSAPCI